MRHFALTYPQLVGDLVDAGVDDAGIERAARVYEFAERMADGLYRPQGQPFLCHLVRVASITLAQQPPFPVALAAMVHASYELHQFRDSRRRPPDRRRRAQVAAAVGADVEELVHGYHDVPWASRASYHLTRPDDPRGSERFVVMMRLANDLEDLLDAAPRCCTAPLVDVAARAAIARRIGWTSWPPTWRKRPPPAWRPPPSPRPRCARRTSPTNAHRRTGGPPTGRVTAWPVCPGPPPAGSSEP